MLIGVLSDTHDRDEITRRAVDLLLAHGAAALIHCGDLTSEPILDLLVAPVPAYFVFGNNDWDHAALEAYAKHQGIRCLGTHATLDLGNRKLAITHGDRNSLSKSLLAQDPHYLLTGHTHVPHDQQQGLTRHVNPGALQRTRKPSVCTIDTARDAVQFHLL